MQQIVRQPWGTTAFGAGSVKAAPDLVRIRFKVVRVEQAPSAAFAAATKAVHDVRQALRQHGVTDQAVEHSQLGLQSSWTYGSERRFLGYECEASFVVESGDLQDAQSLLVDLVAAGANEIQGVFFDVRAKAELRAEARRKAVTVARAKAELYAEAAGVRLGAVLHIEDVDPEGPGSQRYRSHSSVEDASPEDLAPGHVVVSAAVILGFSINHD